VQIWSLEFWGVVVSAGSVFAALMHHQDRKIVALREIVSAKERQIRQDSEAATEHVHEKLHELHSRVTALEHSAITQEALDRHLGRMEELMREGFRDLRAEIRQFHQLYGGGHRRDGTGG